MGWDHLVLLVTFAEMLYFSYCMVIHIWVYIYDVSCIWCVLNRNDMASRAFEFFFVFLFLGFFPLLILCFIFVFYKTACPLLHDVSYGFHQRFSLFFFHFSGLWAYWLLSFRCSVFYLLSTVYHVDIIMWPHMYNKFVCFFLFFFYYYVHTSIASLII